MKPIKVLFACIPFDGHFNPLTGLAVYLKNRGHDVRWYTQQVYEKKLAQMGVHHYPFKHAVQYNQFNVDEVFAERLQYAGQIKRLNFDLQHAFLKRAPEFFSDIKEINQTFNFDVLIADVMFTAIPLVKEKLKKPVLSIGVLPIVESSKDLPPAGLGMEPSASFFGKLKQDFLRFITDRILFAKSHRIYSEILSQYGITASGNIFDLLVQKSTYFLQSGTPGFEYKRSDLGKNIRFVGALPSASTKERADIDFESKFQKFKKVILVTQGTIEKDPGKLIVPVLENFKDSEYLVIATTGGSKTKELRERYPQSNIVIEDFIPFEHVLRHVSVFITNGGFGGVMLAIGHGVPLVVAGVHEGKNEINARVGYFRLGINLKTESPSGDQIARGVAKVIDDPQYKKNVQTLSQELSTYDARQLCEEYMYEAILTGTKSTATRSRQLQH